MSVKNPIMYICFANIIIILWSYVPMILGKQYRRFKINNNNTKNINLKNHNLFHPILLVVNTRYANTNSHIKDLKKPHQGRHFGILCTKFRKEIFWIITNIMNFSIQLLKKKITVSIILYLCPIHGKII